MDATPETLPAPDGLAGLTPAASLTPPGDGAAETAPAQKPWLVIQGGKGTFALELADLWRFRDLTLSLAGRDLKLRYKQTALGVIWVVLQPLMAAGVFSFVFGKVAKLPSDGLPYFLFSYTGLLGWNLFSNTLTKVSNCLIGNSHLISKVFFPRLVLPLSTVPSTMVDFAVSLAMLAVMMVLYRVHPGVGVLLLPLAMLVLLALAMGIGLVTSALTVSYRDVQYMLPVFLQILLYASPIAYAVSAVPPELRKWYVLNPLSAPLETFRASLLHTATPGVGAMLWSLLIASALFVVGLYSFKRMERRFADVI